MTATKKNKRLLVNIKDMNDEELGAAVDAAIDALLEKDEEIKPAEAVAKEKNSRIRKKPAHSS